VDYRVDGSNADRRIPRNRVRHELLPLLAREFAPAIVNTLARTAVLARDDAEALEEIAAAAYPTVVQREGDVVSLDARVAELPRAVARRIVRRAFGPAGPGGLAFEHVEAILRLCQAPPSTGGLDLPGFRLERGPSHVVATPPAPGRRRRRRGWLGALETALEPRRDARGVELPVPGKAVVGEGLGTITATLEPGMVPAGVQGYEEVRVELDRLVLPLRVRFRRPGDRFRPAGAPGRRKLQDVFVDRKVPRALRDRIPLVVDAHDAIVWVVGHGIAEEYRVPPSATGVLLLKFSPVGGLV
jgi:tRNA(Ile)-lysidine synthase